MPRSKQRVTEDSEQLQRYLDGELTLEQRRAFQQRLSASPELQRDLTELQLVGGLLRRWADDAERRTGSLVEPTLLRIEAAEQKRSRHASLGMAVAALLLLLLPASGRDSWPSRVAPISVTELPQHAPAAAAIELLEAGEQHAQVFTVGSASTPVVWLADDAAEEEAEQQGPG
jgi:anti-sigma factor RsiW